MSGRRKTPEEYYKECKEKGYDLPIEDYKGVNIKIKYKCNKGHIYSQLPSNHLKGQSCPICGGTRKKTSEEYYKECKEKGYDLPIEDYKNARTKIKHKCPKGHIYSQTPHSHLKGRGCPKCNTTKKVPEHYSKECKSKGLDLPIESYINSNTKIKHTCTKGHIYKQLPHSHLEGYGCPYCRTEKVSKLLSKNPQEYLNECKEKGLDLPIEDYKNNKTKIKHKCSKGHVYLQTPCDHLQGNGCPVCNESHGERFIRNYLDKHNIKYIPQKKFKDLKDTKPLSYDFYLPEYNTLIEYQGIQHYESVSFNGKDYTDLEKQQEHDKLKKEYAKNNGYKLLTLHYSLDTQEKVDRYLVRRIED